MGRSTWLGAVAIALAAATLAACRRPPAPEPERVVYLRRADSAAAQVDTVVVAEPAGLTLRLRDSLPVLGLLAPRALDAAGAEVRWFAPRYVAGPSDVLRLRNGHLVAVGVGDGTLDVRPTRLGENLRRLPPRPVTRVPVRVRR